MPTLPVLAILLAGFSLLPVGSLLAAPQIPSADKFPAGIQLPAKARGNAAIAALGQRLPEVAAFYGRTPAELRELFTEDRCVWVDTRGRVFYVCEGLGVSEQAVTGGDFGPTDSPPYPTDQTFRLHSRKGAGRVIYLDFDGHDASTTSWGADAIARPFDTDGNPYAFSTAERDRIAGVWQRVAEDFSMYDIDVTTEDPGTAALIKSNSSDTNFGVRVVVGGSSLDWYKSSGGVAYLRSFDDNSDNPCWVFPGSLSNSEKNIAEAASHEAGHTLGLSHDGTTTGSEYYSGQGSWAPIMGVGYSKAIVQWSKGEYANANRTEDDLTLMLTYGGVYRADGHGNATGTATPLAGVSFGTNGVISQATDLDFFSFNTGDGPISITATPYRTNANLRIEMKLYNSGGGLLQTATSADSSTIGTRPVTLATTLAAGTYHISIDGIGNGDPATTGYSDYSSLGQYDLSGTLPSNSTWLPTAAGSYTLTAPANWSSSTRPQGIGATLRLNNNIAGAQSVEVATDVTLGQLFLGDANATHGFTIQSAGGSLQFQNLAGPAAISKTTGAADNITAPLTLLGDLRVTNTTANPLTLAGTISGAGALTKWGSGTLILDSVAAHTGGTAIAAGTLALGGFGGLNGNIVVNSGATLDLINSGGMILQVGQNLAGAGVVVGDVAVNALASVQPGGAAAAGTLTFSNNLVLNHGAALRFDLAPGGTPSGGTNDLIVVVGDLTLNGTVAFDPALQGTTLASPGVYTVIRYFGTLTGGAANLAVVNHYDRYVYTFDDSTPGEIQLVVSGAPLGLVWQGNGTNNIWNLTAADWRDGVAPAAFQQLDNVSFTDSGSTAPALTLSGALLPQSVTVNAAGSYTFQGAGKISGAATLTKQGAGTLTVSNPNDFTGPVAVSAGTLKVGHASALGTTNNATSVASGATLDVNAVNLGAESVLVSGSGIGGAGAIINSSGAAQNNALRFVTLNGNATFGGTGRWDIRANPTARLTGNNFSLAKTGANAVWLVDLENTGLGDVHVIQGTLGIQDSTTLGNAANTAHLAAGATLALWNTDVNTITKKFALNGGTLSSDAGNNVVSGTVAVNNGSTVSVAAGLELQGVISGAGALTKTGLGTLSLKAANTLSGPIIVSQGTLRAGNAAAFGATNNGVTIANDARLDIAGFNLGAEPVTVTGDGLGNAGAIVNYGASQQNALRFVTFSGNTTFGGINRWDLRANPTGSLAGNNRALTKRGPNEVWLVNLGDTGLGAITVAEGKLGFQGTTTMGNAASTITVSSGAKLGIYAAGTNILAKVMTLTSGTINNSSGANTFTGSCSMTGSNTFDVASSTSLEMTGTITNTGTLWAVGSGALILSGNNSYSGGTVIQAGTLQIGDGGGTGTPGSGAITNNAALVFNRTNDFTVTSAIRGTGTLTKLGAGVLTLGGNSSFTGNVTLNALNAGVLRLRHSAALGVGPKTINLKSGGSPNSAGSFGVEVENNITLASNLSWNISNDGLANSPNIPALRSRSGVNTIAGNLLLQSGGGGTRIVSDDGSTLNLTGNVTTDAAGGRDLFLDGAGSGVFSGTISNGTTATMLVHLNKEGSGMWTFAGANASSGITLVKAGTLLLTGLGGTNSLTVSNGATLSGTGVIRGLSVINGTLAPGTAAAIGALTISNGVTLNGTTAMRIAKSPGPVNDQLRGVTSLNYGGNLIVTKTTGTLVEGDVFQLFSANTRNNTFASLTLPALDPGLTWSNRLALDGSLLVAQIPIEPPVIASVTLNGSSLDLEFTSQAGVNYVLEQAGELVAPVLWTPVSTNAGTGGVLIFSPTVDPLLPSQFFRLSAY